MNGSNEINWPQAVWDEINNAVLAEVNKVRVAQKVFPTKVFDTNPTEIPNEVIKFPDLTIAEGQTKPFVEIYQEFPLTSTQVKKEPDTKICKTLARMAAKAIALAEDTIIFQGEKGTLPANVKVELVNSALDGILGEAVELVPVVRAGRPGLLYGENTFSAVAEGIAKLVEKSQAPFYALFLPTKAYADTFVPPSPASLVTTAERIRPLTEGGFYGTGTLSDEDKNRKGLLVALGGEPTNLYVGREVTTEFVRKDGQKYFFRVVERVQFVARDPRAFVLLGFEIEIKKDDKSGIVAQLHSLLEKVKPKIKGFPAIPQSEKSGKLFGDGTVDAVKKFQNEKGIPETGVVDVNIFDMLKKS
ncbi:MAG: hypothetical protein B6D35_08680 [Candidatus Brocadia sp. UTAMX2]|jgi:uncharacterized linocin/CFP29 family protein|nr:MAG: hypothetical protein B6D35_08680 [Candidatus Brocadia sp. UTAMX2]